MHLEASLVANIVIAIFILYTCCHAEMGILSGSGEDREVCNIAIGGLLASENTKYMSHVKYQVLARAGSWLVLSVRKLKNSETQKFKNTNSQNHKILNLESPTLGVFHFVAWPSSLNFFRVDIRHCLP